MTSILHPIRFMLQLRLFVALMLPQSLLAQPNTPDFLWSVREHSGAVNALAISPDGRRVASASADHTLKLLGMADGQLVRTFTGHEDVVYAVAFSPDSGQLASGGADQMVLIWDVRNSVPLASLKGHTDRINAVAFAPNGVLVASASDDLTIRLWRLPQYDLLRVLEGPKKRIVAVAFSTDGTQVLGASTDGSLWKWNAATGAPVGDPLVVPTNAPAMALWPGAGWAAVSVPATAEVEVFDLRDGSRIGVLTGHSQRPSVLALSRGADTILTTSRDATLRFWEAPRGAALLNLTQECDGIVSLCFSPVENLFAGGRANGEVFVARDSSTAPSVLAQPQGQSVLAGTNVTLTINATGLFPLQYAWRVRGEAVPGGTGATLTLTNIQVPDAGDYQVVVSNPRGSVTSQTATVRVSLFDTVWMKGGHYWGINAVAYSPDGTVAASAGEDGTIKLWRVSDGACLRRLIGHLGPVNSIAFAPDGQMLFSAGDDRSVRFWRVSDGIALRIIAASSNHLSAIACSPDGKSVAAGGNDSLVRIWRISDGALVQTIIQPYPFEFPVMHLAFSSGGSNILVGMNYYVSYYRVADAALLGSFPPGADPAYVVRAMALSPDGQFAAVARSDGPVGLWRLSDFTLVQSYPNTADAASLAISPDGQELATGGDSGGSKLRIWITATATPLATNDFHQATVTALAYSPTGSRLLSGGGTTDSLLAEWNTQTHQLERLLTLPGRSRNLALSPDGQWIATGGPQGGLYVWRASNGALERSIPAHQGDVTAIAFSQNGQWLASAGLDNTLRLWRCSNWSLAWGITLAHRPEALGFGCGDLFLVSGGGDAVNVWDTFDGDMWRSIEGGVAPGINSLGISPDGLALCCVSTNIGLYKSNQVNAIANGVLFWQGPGGIDFLYPLNSFSQDGRTLATGGGDLAGAFLRVWRMDDGGLIAELRPPGSSVTAGGFAPGGRLFGALASYLRGSLSYGMYGTRQFYDARAFFWQTTNWNCLREVQLGLSEAGNPNAYALHFSPCPGYFTVLTPDNSIYYARDPFAPSLAPSLQLRPGRMSFDGFRFAVEGTPGFNYRLQTSTDLTNWQYWRTVVSINAVHEFLDDDARMTPRRFYRAVLP